MYLFATEQSSDVTEDNYDIQWGTNVVGMWLDKACSLCHVQLYHRTFPPYSTAHACYPQGGGRPSRQTSDHLYVLVCTNQGYQMGHAEGHQGKTGDVT